MAKEAEENKRLPVKFSWSKLAEIQNSVALAPCLQRLDKSCEGIALASAQADIDGAWTEVNTVGKGLCEELHALVHCPARADLSSHGAKNGPADQRGGEPRWGDSFANLRLLRLWSARVLRLWSARVRRHSCGILLSSAPRWFPSPARSLFG